MSANATPADPELDQFVIALRRAGHRLAGGTAGPLARWDAASVWRTDGSRSAASRFARDSSLSTTTAKVELRRACKLRDMPATAAAVTAGRLSMDHVDLLARADQPHRHDLFARDEELLLEQCATLRYIQAAKAVEYWCQRADAETDTPPDPEPPSRLHASTTLDGTVRLDGLLDAFDGLGDDSVNRMCELANGTVITPGQLVPYLGVAEMETILFDGPFTVIAASNARTFTGRLRRAIEVRDRHCQHPFGCDVPAPDCDVDHIVPVSKGGVTSQFDGKIECEPHNRDATLHDHDGTPLPERPVTVLDEIRARLRLQMLHEHHDGDDGDDGDSDAGDEPAA